MPSPFPGMDPYKERESRWRDVHHGLISEIEAGLNGQIVPKYYARIQERIYISDEYDAGRKALDTLSWHLFSKRLKKPL